MGKSESLMPPVHPGEILREDFMKPRGLSINKLALDLHVPATRIHEIVHERRRITADSALRLARYFNTNPEFWLNLQNFFDLEVERRSGAEVAIERHMQPAHVTSSSWFAKRRLKHASLSAHGLAARSRRQKSPVSSPPRKRGSSSVPVEPDSRFRGNEVKRALPGEAEVRFRPR
jgi:addiction module HigA family antidote